MRLAEREVRLAEHPPRWLIYIGYAPGAREAERSTRQNESCRTFLSIPGKFSGSSPAFPRAGEDKIVGGCEATLEMIVKVPKSLHGFEVDKGQLKRPSLPHTFGREDGEAWYIRGWLDPALGSTPTQAQTGAIRACLEITNKV
ncbi:hypothetical protein ACRALDRAFT_212365 [Sodiomyces alcalophilus JCM 7366]|uniref:uncharacterized protein n=1 Tax=Sodiomyces alcalophilus JCM 7366 TaxID=591952 RepID=UPI0039B50236